MKVLSSPKLPDLAKAIFDPVAVARGLSGVAGGGVGSEGGVWGFMGEDFGSLGADGEAANEFYRDRDFYDASSFFDAQGVLDDLVDTLR